MRLLNYMFNMLPLIWLAQKNSTPESTPKAKTIRKAFSRKRCLWRKHQQNLQNPYILNKYKEAEVKCRQLVHEYEAVTERRTINSSNAGSFYRHINKRMMLYQLFVLV